jgi:hypothetical protein
VSEDGGSLESVPTPLNYDAILLTPDHVYNRPSQPKCSVLRMPDAARAVNRRSLGFDEVLWTVATRQVYSRRYIIIYPTMRVNTILSNPLSWIKKTTPRLSIFADMIMGLRR